MQSLPRSSYRTRLPNSGTGISAQKGTNEEHYSTTAPDAPCTFYLPKQGGTGSSWGPRTVVYQRKNKWIVVEQSKNEINLQGCCVRLYLSLSLIMMLEPTENKLRETFPFKGGKVKPVPRWGQSSVQGGQHHFPQIPLKTLQLETQLHTHSNHSYFLVSLLQSPDLRRRRDLWCYLKSSVLSNFRAAAVPQVSCTKPCCVWTCEFSQKTNECINGYFLTP